MPASTRPTPYCDGKQAATWVFGLSILTERSGRPPSPGICGDSDDVRKVYYLFDDIEPDRVLENYITRDEPRFLIESDGQRFVYQLPIRNTIEEYQGTLLVYVGYSSLLSSMASRNVLEAGRSSRLAGEKAYIFNSAVIESRNELQRLGDEISNQSDQPQQRVIGENQGALFNVYTQPAAQYGVVAYIAGAEELRLTFSLKALLLVLVFLTLFLVSFLILSFRQDDMTVITERIKTVSVRFS